MHVPKLLSLRQRPVVDVNVSPVTAVLDEGAFRRVLDIEEKRTERSERRFVLMLVDCTRLIGCNGREDYPAQIAQALTSATRETDITGWYEQGTITGTIFTELGPADGRAITKALLNKVSDILSTVLSIEQIRHVHLSFHVFPDDWNDDRSGTDELYPGDSAQAGSNNGSLKFKRLLDIVLSLFALVLLFPAFAVIAAIIKLTSPGPVFFRQERVGRFGHRFTFLKFRSMYVNNRQQLHQEFVRQLIRGGDQTSTGNGPRTVYKIVNDPRVTPIGSFLRRTSLDEIPQFINVLKGEMSLVGPRPPIPYEVDCYATWHRRRLIPVKPGITGLWQVSGRSRVGFDDMIRLDLQYARKWSLWLDLKILLQTPLAVIGGEGAY